MQPFSTIQTCIVYGSLVSNLTSNPGNADITYFAPRLKGYEGNPLGMLKYYISQGPRNGVGILLCPQQAMTSGNRVDNCERVQVKGYDFTNF